MTPDELAALPKELGIAFFANSRPVLFGLRMYFRDPQALAMIGETEELTWHEVPYEVWTSASVPTVQEAMRKAEAMGVLEAETGGVRQTAKSL